MPIERVAVCGLGKVGRPILGLLREKGLKAVGYDHIPLHSEVNLSQAVDRSDACIFIVPTPSRSDGSFSNDHLLEALTRFKGAIPMARKSDYLYIITSTTTPGSCDKFREIVGDHVVYKPEFIRLEHVDYDLRHPAYHLIGAHLPEDSERAHDLFQRISLAPAKCMSLLEAELAKITLNCALTMKISLANQLHLVAKRLGADSRKIMDAVGTDPRIGNAYLNPGWPYGGPCLPRDNRMFQYVSEEVGIDAALSVAADTINDMIAREESPVASNRSYC